MSIFKFSRWCCAAAFFCIVICGFSHAAEYSTSVAKQDSEPTGSNYTLYLGDVKKVRGVLVLISNGSSGAVYADAGWRSMCDDLAFGLIHMKISGSGTTDNPKRVASLGGGRQLLEALTKFAESTQRPSMQHAHIITWGHSATGTFAATFAALYPERTMGFVRYHSHLRGVPVDINKSKVVPGFMLTGEKDGTAGIEDSRIFFENGRKQNAPWCMGITPGAGHSATARVTGNGDESIVMQSWIRQIAGQRLPQNIPDGPYDLLPMSSSVAWLGTLGPDNTAATNPQAWPYVAFAGNKDLASWLPDSEFANAWLKHHGTGTPVAARLNTRMHGYSAISRTGAIYNPAGRRIPLNRAALPHTAAPGVYLIPSEKTVSNSF